MLAFSLISIAGQEATLEAGAEVGTAEAEPAAGAVPMEVSIATGELRCGGLSLAMEPFWDRAGQL